MQINSPVHLVFIHGAWVSGWGWDALLPNFSKTEYVCHVVNLPGSENYSVSLNSQASMEDYIAHVGELLATIHQPVYLVAHSGGGVTATSVAEAFYEQISGVVYVAGMMLPSGVSFVDICQSVAQTQGVNTQGITGYLSPTEHGSKVKNAEAVQQIFLQDADAGVAEKVFEKMVVQPDAARKVITEWRQDRAGSIPKCYIKAAQDRSLVPEVQDAMIALGQPKMEYTMDCGHFPQVVQPTQLAEHIKAFIDNEEALHL